MLNLRWAISVINEWGVIWLKSKDKEEKNGLISGKQRRRGVDLTSEDTDEIDEIDRSVKDIEQKNIMDQPKRRQE